jgi:hypothetical protein
MWNNKSETQALIAEYGGATPVMKVHSYLGVDLIGLVGRNGCKFVAGFFCTALGSATALSRSSANKARPEAI